MKDLETYVKELEAKNAELEARVKKLETEKEEKREAKRYQSSSESSGSYGYDDSLDGCGAEPAHWSTYP